VLRTKEYLAAVRVVGDALLLNTMHFAEEVREAEGIPAAGKIDEAEAKMALQLVNAMSEKFDIEQFKDHYNDALLQLIEKKLEGKPIRAKKEEKQPTNVLDLMSRLKESLEKSASEAAPASRRKSASTAKATPAKKTTAVRAAAKDTKQAAAGHKTTAKTKTAKPHLKLAA
jgi:DNA end-binding protein Ku